MRLGRYSMGIGDRFAREGRAQLAAFVKARAQGVEITPVWNKSNREHQIVGTTPDSVRAEADATTRTLGWTGAYYVDADHIGLKNVEAFIGPSDFFTIDVAEFAGRPAGEDEARAFAGRHRHLARRLVLPGVQDAFELGEAHIEAVARKYLPAVREAGRIYRHLAAAKGAAGFITEISMDETDLPQTPGELLLILAAVAEERIPVQTLAPKFTGRFNKGVDYEGDAAQFEREFNADVAVLAFAAREFGLPPDLKLSVHSGSDKFSLYAPIRRALLRHGAGVHLKTAGTTWLEEMAGLALAGGDALAMAREIYARAYDRFDELCRPYAAVIAIDRGRLPAPREVNAWTGPAYAAALRHDPLCRAYNPHFRQLLHVAYKVAAEMGGAFLQALESGRELIGGLVAENLFDNHLRPLFMPGGQKLPGS